MTDTALFNAPPPVTPPLYPGDPAPWFRAASDVNPLFQFATLGGRRLLLAFLPSLSQGEGKQIADVFLAGAERFAAGGAALILISLDPADAQAKVPDGVAGVRFMFDPDQVIAKLYGMVDDAGAFKLTSFIIDERLRIAAIVQVREADQHARTALELYDRFGQQPAPRRAAPQAPVMIIPDVFEPALCERLIAGYESSGGLDSGFMVERDGKTVEQKDYSHKRRADWALDNDDLTSSCRIRVQRRIMPEIFRAYQFRATRIERYLVACYEAENGGHFAPHRDNTTAGTAHRRFAVSINLNDDYDGGNLVFPEFGRAHFRPPIGGACVFSCSLLHEATKVTRGRRFVFVPFLYDEAAKVVRDANLKFIG